ncbi:RidA family protein [Phenylobacterium sp.]|uniref:RidA family protein n=1 Tax=Phenylobacterium sp. TaxID=1871053 RepID=UPI002ED80818
MRQGLIEERLAALGHVIPEPANAAANYVPWVRSGSLLYVSGQVSIAPGRSVFGTVGATLDLATAREAAQLCALNLLAHTRAACDGDLGRVSRVVRLGGFVQAAADFNDISAVIDGASDLIASAFGDAGRHARAAVGVFRLPRDVAVEVDGLFELDA